MYEYKIVLPFKVENCIQCPFRNQRTMYDGVQSMDAINGVTQIFRTESYCVLKESRIIVSEMVQGYQSTCPLKDKIRDIREDLK